jgi:hypothetical protein
MKDQKLKLEDIEDPHTLGGTSYIPFTYIGRWAGGQDDEDDLFPDAPKKGTVNSRHLLTAELAAVWRKLFRLSSNLLDWTTLDFFYCQ